MGDADVLYAEIIDQRLSSDRTVGKIEETARRLKAEGRGDVARALLDHALRGAALMPNLKQRLRDFATEELAPDVESESADEG